jgi:hypothetical protein
MAKMTTLTHERLLTVMDYEPATGVFRWKVRSSNRIHIGDRAGVVNGKGHRFIMIDGEKFQASRLAIFYVRGEWPTQDVKFLNGDSDDCSISNLQEMSRIESARLRGALSTNTTGLRGVSPAARGKWKAAISANYQQIMLGVFDTKEEASAIYEHAMSILSGVKTPQEADAAADEIIQYRRKRVAWERLRRTGRPHAWSSFEQFAADVGRMESDESTVAAEDESRPIAANNFRWLLRPEGKFDRSTKEGRAAYARAYREANPGRWRHAHLQKNYGATELDYFELLAKQNGVCAICGHPELNPRIAEKRSLSFDHDHEAEKATGEKKIRGLLCGNCNHGLGMFGNDRPDKLRSAADYLDKYYGRKRPWSVPVIEEITHLPIGQKILMEARANG